MLWAFFSLEFIGLYKSRICLQREFYVFVAGHCVYKGFFNLGRHPFIFHGALRFFLVILGRVFEFKTLEIEFSSFWQYLGFGGCFF